MKKKKRNNKIRILYALKMKAKKKGKMKLYRALKKKIDSLEGK